MNAPGELVDDRCLTSFMVLPLPKDGRVMLMGPVSVSATPNGLVSFDIEYEGCG